MLSQGVKRVVCVGGGHCNCQVIKLLKNLIEKESQPSIDLTLVSDSSTSYYSGMLPGTISQLYTDDDLKVHLGPLAHWCKAKFIEQRVVKVMGDKNQIKLENGDLIDYDVLALNVGSKTKDTGNVKGVWEHGLTTRPINDLIPKVQKREKELKEQGITPQVVVCGAGAAGTELSFAFKRRWSAYFNQNVKVTLIASHSEPVHTEIQETKSQIMKLLKEHDIDTVYDAHVAEVTPDAVILTDGTKIDCNVAVWATGAEPQGVTAESDLDIMKGFFQVNDYLQSTSHKNIFAGGDCITMENYADKEYPTKAGVYAVRQGPIIAQNIMNFIKNESLEKYEPQTGFLSLMMTGDGNCIGSKFGICFVGKWVWHLKDYIDMSFMNLFNPIYLFKDYEKQGMKEPLASTSLFDDDSAETKKIIEDYKKQAYSMPAKEAAEILGCQSSEEDFHHRFQILTRMHIDEQYRGEVIQNYKPPYYS